MSDPLVPQPFPDLLAGLEPHLAATLTEWLVRQGWLEADAQTWTPAGKSLLEDQTGEAASGWIRAAESLADNSRLSVIASHAEGELFGGSFGRLVHETSMSADAFLAAAARVGLFSNGIPERYPRSSEPCRLSLHELTRRDYIVRPATETDLDRLCELEELCWQHTRTPRTQIAARLQNYPDGQFVLERAGETLGVIYSQRIADTDALMTCTAAGVHELHDPSGSTVQLLAVNIDPRAQNASYGDQLLEFMLQRCGLMTGVERVVGVTLCKSYDAASGTSFAGYIRQDGSSRDPVLAFHHAHGAEVVEVIPGYRPEDRANLANGVLVSYDILHRQPRRATATVAAAGTRTFDRPLIDGFVQREAAQLLGLDETIVDVDRPLMEMGLDSADLLKFQRLCEEHFGLKLQAGFFFEYSTVRKVVDYVAGMIAPAPAESVSEAPATASVTVGAAMVADSQPAHAAESDIAIVGMSCKLPGGIENPDDFWRVLSSAECVIGTFPRERRSWPSGADFPAIDQGGFVKDAEAFDAAFFRISPAEAQITDPQQRMLLELAWACFENAGTPPAALKGSDTGVFVGASNTDYSRLIGEAGIEIEAHHGVGSSLAILANRISYFFDFSGPSLLIDTACSSSLVALHAAVQSLRAGECATALVGGVNLICQPDLSIAYHKAGMLARDGRCKVFDAGADGYVRAEGAVVLLLKPFRSAIADGNQIHAVIRGSATNHGGLAGGLTVPNPQKQKELLVAAWKDAGIVAQDLTYIEAHGTGTSLGDPIELQGVQAAYAAMSAADRPAPPCGVGSVKSNVGHLESAAGLTGLLKIILSFQHREIPASVHFSRLNPKIRLEGTPLFVQDQLRTWDAPSHRIAALSSFGSGGANAHVVVQEYPASVPADGRDDQYLFVLSAATQERLHAYAGRVIQWLERDVDRANFADAIYTWQVGRTPMQDRLAIRATDRADLLDKLKQWQAGKDASDCWSGQVAQKGAGANPMWQTKSGRQLIEQACLQGDLELLGMVWASGIEIDWRRYHAENRTGGRKPALVSLPTYPFARDRYWITAAAGAQPLASAATTAVLHPLLHDNTSDLSEQRFTTRFTGDEFFLSDHVVKGAKVLPGVCYLEMARAAVAASAAEGAGTIRLKDVVWTSPVIVDEPARVHTAVFVDERGELGYEIYSDGADEEGIVHGHGQVSFSVDEDLFVDLPALRQGADTSIETTRCYGAWSAVGIEYGPAFRAIERLWSGRTEAGERYLLAEVALPAAVAGTREQYLLHPSVMDSALQATLALSLADAGGATRKAHLPFALEELEIRHRSPERALVHIRERADRLQKLDIDISDENGRLCARLRGFTTRPLERELAKPAPRGESPVSTTLLVPRWEPVIPPTGVSWPSREAHVLLVGGTSEQQEAIRARYARVTAVEAGGEIRFDATIDHVLWVTPVSSATGATDERLVTEQSHGVLSGLRLIQALLQLGYATKNLGWTVVTWGTHPVVHDDRVQPAHASVHGLVGSLAKEYSHWQVRLVDLPAAGEWPLDAILSLPRDEQGDAWAWRAGEWHRQQLSGYEPAAAVSTSWRQGGVYVVIGGAGGIGEAFSEYLIRNHQARLIWIGRRELDAAIQAKIDRLGALGPAPRYISADAADLEALTRAYQAIKAEHRDIHGVVHAAIALLDKSLAQMDEARFQAGLSAKVDVAVRMAQVFAQEPLDFVLFFSSFLSFVKPAGQSNYLAGSTFEDAFARQLQDAWPCRVKVVNWGYWGSKGIVASEAYRTRMAQNGFASIDPEEGMAAVEQLLAAPVPQIVFVKGEPRGLASLPLAHDRVAIAGKELPNVVEQLSPRTGRLLLPEQAAQHVEQVQDLQRLMTQLLFSQLQSVSFETTPAYRRWLEESRRALANVESIPDASALWSEWDARTGEWLANANLRAHVRLVDATLRALPEVVTGRRPATDIMFPNASVDLVEGIYKHHHVADYFNAVAADVVAEFVEARLKDDPAAEIRIIELGAGTGGTSDGIFRRLRPSADRIAEYCYTDISRAFLMHAEETYGPTTPYLTYRLFNVEQPLASQGMAAGSYDLAIATNVLHATRGIRNTLRNAKATLKRNGLLVLNELLGNSLFMHLTFGLLEGWWLHEDAALRTPGTPLLAPESWQRVLESEGFRSVLFPAAAAHGHGQQIVVAASDGVIRQKEQAGPEVPKAPVAQRAPQQRPAPAPNRDADAITLRERAALAFKKIVGATLKLPVQQIDSREELEQYGIDSILVVKMVNALNGIFAGVTSTLFFEYRTIDALVDHFLETEKEAVMRWVGVTESVAQDAVPVQATPSVAEDETASESATIPVRRRQRNRTRNVAAPEPVEVPERSQDIAIIGLSGRYPQSVDVDAFWRNLRDGKDCIVEVPKERWDWRQHFTEDRNESGRHFSKLGGFIDGVDEFDPLFFNISPRDAKYIDPQERLFLQHAWMAVEDAGYTRAALQAPDAHDLDGQVGVYAGVMYSEYQLLSAEARPEDVRMGFAGNMASIANRVSYALNVHGPSMTVDTMCSSSLTAIHVACQDLKSGRTSLAIAGGVNVSVHPNKYRMLSAGQFISADGHCQAFGEGGDGFIPAEGVGVVVLKRLADAERDGDHIYGVIRGSAVNHGGKTNGYTVPNPQAQASAISRALLESKIDPRHISYIEAHGTGTRLGDPIEIAALTRAFRHSTEDTGFCLVGSVKSNIGHCESAAGIAGVTKVLLQMQHRQVVASLHAAQLNPYIDFAQTPFVVSQTSRPWDQPVVDGRTRPRIAGVSSFGAGGSNAHLIIEEYQSPVHTAVAAGNVAIVLSARTAEQLKQRASDLLEFLQVRRATIDLSSVAYTLQAGREAMDERFGFVAASVGQAIEKLEAWLRGDQALDQTIEDAFEGQVRRNKEALSVFSVDADLQQTVDKWIEKGKLARLLELWAKGLELDWNKLYAGVRPRRISLPVYPFARERYWIDVTPAGPDTVTGTASLHPLLHRNTSDLSGLRFSSTFTGGEAFLHDRVVPTVACLEMVRAAIGQALPEQRDAVLELRDTAFGPPIVVDGETEISIALWSALSSALSSAMRSAEEQVAFEIECGANIYCQGIAVLSRDASPVVLDVERQNERVERLRISPSGPELAARIRPAAVGTHAVDVDLCDEHGKVVVQMYGAVLPQDREPLVESSVDPSVESIVHPIVETPVEAMPEPIIETTEPPPFAPVRKEISFLVAAPVAAAPVEPKKRLRTVLSAPGATTPAVVPASSSAAKAARITLAAAGKPNAGSATPLVSPVRVYDCGNGIFSIEIAASRSDDGIGHFLKALERVEQETALKVLVLEGIEHCFGSGGREKYNEAVDGQFFRRLVSFAYPVIAALPGDVIGSGLLAAALCDFMVCSESAYYGYTEAERYFRPTAAETLLFSERFGEAQATELLFASMVASGALLRENGWTLPVVTWPEVEVHALQLASALAAKSQDSLRLLKQHLSRRLSGLVDSLTRVDVPAAEADDVAVVQCGHAGLQDADATRGKAIVVVFDDADVPEAVAAEVRRLVLDAEAPVVAAMPGDAKGNVLLAAQFCDAAVYCSTATYSAPPAAAALFAHRLGRIAAGEIVLTGVEYSGAELRQRARGLNVAESNEVVPAAIRLARASATVKATRPALPQSDMGSANVVDVDSTGRASAATSTGTAIPLQSTVVTATAHANGVVVVKMEDRGARNMFSGALMEGIREAFAHIEQAPAYKAVVLTGYDSYFCSGGTKENLLDIQQGKVRFTDLEIFRAALDCRLPVVAAMQGHGIGAGWTMGMLADVVLLSDESHYVSPYMSYGFTPGAGATDVIPETLGVDLGRESLFTGRQYSGAELQRRGIAVRVLPRAEVLATAMAMADRIARAPRALLVALKQQLTSGLRARLEETIRLELAMHEVTFVGSADTRAQIERSFRQESERPAPVATPSVPVASGDITAALRTLLASELQIPESAVDESMQFVDLGLDSINAVSWIRKINEKYRTSIEATKVYAYPTLAQLGRYVKEEAERRGTVVRPTPPEPMVRHGIPAPVHGDIAGALKTLLAAELQIAESAIDGDVQFVDLGLDSINAVSWIRKINDKYQTSIEATKVYAYPTLAQLGGYVKAEAEKRGTLPVAALPIPTLAIPMLPIARSQSRGNSQKLVSRRPGRQTTHVSGTARANRPEPIAIIGMAGQFPQANNVAEFWQNIATGKNCITQVPPERWDLNAYYQPGDAAAGKTYCQWAGMIDDYDRFDPLFFNLSPTEAESMDPQQRLFLQACWHGIESAGYDAARLSGSKCGVFVGCTVGDYQSLSQEQALSAQGFTGNAMSILAARIAYFLNLQGPCVSIDTACSSSLVAIAQACDSLISGNSELALAGGVYVMSGPQMHIKTAQATMLSPDGRCYTFDQRANGFVPGEGVGVVLLKRLSDAERDGDIIHAVIEGWGVNQDGKTNGITAPNPESQTRLEQDVYDRHGIDPANIQLIEAHGTGTKLGDPIEVEGLKAAFAKYTRNTGYCAIGSVKSNVGHCLTAAGIAGTIKLALALQHKQLPPTIHFERLNEHIDLGDSPFFVNDRLQEWTANGAARRQAAISSFGFSGTNAHLVVGEYVQPAGVKAATPARVIVPLSARTPEQLRQKASDLLDSIRKTSPDLAEAAYTLQVGRSAMEERLAIVAGSTGELASKLEAWLGSGKPAADVRHGQVRRNNEILGILGEDEDIKDAAVAKWIAAGDLSKLADYWVKGLSFDWNRLYGATKPRRITLPVYPFARERYWIEARPAVRSIASGAVHPLLHRNTSDLKELRYGSTLAGDEFFLRDHRIHADKVLPGVAYLEMAHAAMRQTWPKQSESDIVELRDTVWLKPVVVGEKLDVAISISLFPLDDDRIDYEIHSSDVHCQGQAMFRARPEAIKVDVEQLRGRMQQGRLEAAEVYRMFDTMGLHYGPAHQGITAIYVGKNEVLAQLRLPAGVVSSQRDYVLHPSVTDSALQASIGLLVDPARVPDKPIVPFAVERLRVLSPCTTEMTAWVRYSDGSRAGDKSVKLDIDLCDEQGSVCVEIRSFAVRTFEGDAKPATFDDDFYERLLSGVMSGDVSIDEAVQLS